MCNDKKNVAMGMAMESSVGTVDTVDEGHDFDRQQALDALRDAIDDLEDNDKKVVDLVRSRVCTEQAMVELAKMAGLTGFLVKKTVKPWKIFRYWGSDYRSLQTNPDFVGYLLCEFPQFVNSSGTMADLRCLYRGTFSKNGVVYDKSSGKPIEGLTMETGYHLDFVVTDAELDVPFDERGNVKNSLS